MKEEVHRSAIIIQNYSQYGSGRKEKEQFTLLMMIHFKQFTSSHLTTQKPVSPGANF